MSKFPNCLSKLFTMSASSWVIENDVVTGGRNVLPEIKLVILLCSVRLEGAILNSAFRFRVAGECVLLKSLGCVQ